MIIKVNLKLQSFLREMPQKKYIREFPEFCSILLLFLFLLPISIEAQVLQRYSYSQQKMGTEFRIVFYANDPDLADEVQKESFNRIQKFDEIFSDYKIDSQASRLSSFAGKDTLIDLNGPMRLMISRTMQVCSFTDGIFDVTIGPLTKLWRRAFRRNEFPSKIEIQEAKAKVGCEHVYQTIDHKLKLKKAGMSLDFGGVAKGFAIDDVMRYIQRQGIMRVLIEGGGDIRVGMAPPNKDGWEIALENGEIMILSNIAIASSGSTYKYLEKEGVKYSHIINPHTGYGITNPKTVTVKAATCFMADMIATTFCIAGHEGIAGILANIDEHKVEIIE